MGTSVLIPTRLIHFNTKHISLIQAVFDTYYTAILPIILGFKTQGVLHNSLSL